ncbi:MULTISPECIES: winged helix-turn-helix domain-containing protein [Acidianus]|uniref:ArnR1-like winged helix-turn-helix domain-containing protein n=1 Tax=Candidatus Acidianus copahuensis TaxID=1160895 RepID=A0A031LLR0_9CREN|nr:MULTISPECIES: winged helix-turn-helix domain-containing protein [Acidianus]EZQ01808.1 hypothetical protein CM19_12095 [Candidatus Acidianus copahuensis]NON63535.1 transcriptional regulator [Acidianus sp. RZ1]
MRSKRDQLEIISDIMTVLEEGISSKSGLMKYANLSNNLVEKYVELLVSRGLVENEGGQYKLSEKGERLLKKLKKIRELNLQIAELINSISEEL